MKIILCFALLLLVVGCDRLVYYDLHVENKVDTTLDILTVNYKGEERHHKIGAKSSGVFLSTEGLNKLRREHVETYFSSFVLIKGADTSTYDYMDKRRWEFQPISATEANFYLTVDSADFKK